MANAGIERPGLRGRVVVGCAARRQVVVGVVIGIAVGGGVPPGGVDLRIHVFGGLAVVVITGADLLLHHVMMALHAPDRVYPFRMLS